MDSFDNKPARATAGRATQSRRRWVRRGLFGAAALLAIGAAAAATALALGQRKLQRTVALPPLVAPAWPTADAASLERGRYLYGSRGCADCHGADGSGRTFVDDPSAGLTLRGPNLTRGGAAAIAQYSDTDWVRLLRHGVKPDGRAAFIMPAEDYARMTDEDMAALVAHVRSLPAAAGAGAVLNLPPPMMAAYGLGAIKDASEKIDHLAKPSTPVTRAISVEHGAYVAQMCVGCHGAGLEGGRVPGGPPDWPAAARLVPGAGDVMPRYATAESFLAMLKTGKRPDGTTVRAMPFESLAQLDDIDARALHLYLRRDAAR